MQSTLYKIGKVCGTATSNCDAVFTAVLETVCTMLSDRGCADVHSVAPAEVAACIQHNRRVVWSSGSLSTDVFFHGERVGVKQLRLWYEECTCDHIIVVSVEGPTPFAKKECESLARVQFFTYKDLCVNKTRHFLVPKHERIDATGRDLDKYPKLHTTDAISQYYNFNAGDLIRITRTFGHTEPMYYYRVVCESGG